MAGTSAVWVEMEEEAEEDRDDGRGALFLPAALLCFADAAVICASFAADISAASGVPTRFFGSAAAAAMGRDEELEEEAEAPRLALRGAKDRITATTGLFVNDVECRSGVRGGESR